ncbi:MAG TPA: PilZ domain-containing protein, partial [Syntrophales bacterium]
MYDSEGNQYILSQTSPPIRKSDLGKSFNITSLIRRGDQRVRCGFLGTLEDIISDYQLTSRQRVLALSVVRTSPIETYNLRRHYRVRPAKEWSKRIEVDSMPVNLIDISLGGTLFTHSKEKPIEYGQELQVMYTDNDGNRHIIPSMVKRVWTHL